MPEHERRRQKKQEDVDQKHRVRDNESTLLFDQFHAWEQGTLSIGETPFRPPIEKHNVLLTMARSAEQRANIVMQLQQTYGNRYVQRLIESVVFQPKLTVNASNDTTVQRKWIVANVDKYLNKDKQGKDTITNLNSQGYEVIHFDKYEFDRQFYKDAKCTIKDGSPVKMVRNGWHIRKRREIALSDKRSNSGAASTLVHEVAHAEQHRLNEAALAKGQKQPFADKKAKELDAHIRQAKFNLARGIKQKDPSFVKSGKIDEKAIGAYVDKVYAVGSKKRPYKDTEPTYTIIEKIKPWPKVVK